ncbi:GATA transcription factor 26-like [Helianthus annuus]|uniref:GATA transcription factor 26-like n=1 Tax=Helianthus annuus TaxID=4232 RepID=UPI000B8F7E2C|nr:GATA transcription factor 26-like [Helianthus annuus]
MDIFIICNPILSLRVVPIVLFVLDHFQSQKRTIIKKGEQEPKGTPLWRNGPPSKPVLCNACGSRWRTRGTLSDYVPKHAMQQYTQLNGLPAATGDSGSRNLSSLDEPNTAGATEPNFGNVPRRRRSNLEQIVLSPMERLHKQLYDIVHEDPEEFMKEEVVGDVLINKVDNMMSTQPETALGAMLLNSPPKDPEHSESVSSSSIKTACASTSTENGGNGGDSTSPENGANGGEQGESSFT